MLSHLDIMEGRLTRSQLVEVAAWAGADYSPPPSPRNRQADPEAQAFWETDVAPVTWVSQRRAGGQPSSAAQQHEVQRHGVDGRSLERSYDLEPLPTKRSSTVLRYPRLVCSALEADVEESTVWSSTSDVTCTVCLECITDGDIVQPMANCDHVFHLTCVTQWLQTFPTGEHISAPCPICRRPAAARRSCLSPAEQNAAIRMEEALQTQLSSSKYRLRGCAVQ